MQEAPCIVNPPLHPVYEDRRVRAIFRPMDTEIASVNPGVRQMIGHEFLWRFVGFRGRIPIWIPADAEDLDAYFEVTQTQCPEWDSLWIYETDLDIIRVEKLDA